MGTGNLRYGINGVSMIQFNEKRQVLYLNRGGAINGKGKNPEVADMRATGLPFCFHRGKISWQSGSANRERHTGFT